MFGPQGLGTFGVLVAVFFLLVILAVAVRRWWLRLPVLALAFVPAMLSGVAVVNHYYAYYPSWGAVWQDMANTKPRTIAAVPDLTAPGVLEAVLAEAVQDKKADRRGLMLETQVLGTQSGIKRAALMYLPPEYFQAGYEDKRFPVLELLHGAPGNPYDYNKIMNIVGTYKSAAKQKTARPTVLVMPDSNGGQQNSMQCLDVQDGPRNETYLTVDVPAQLSQRLRLQPPGVGWGIAGFSEGGYCATNLALRHPESYGVVGVMSGYFEPLPKVKLPKPVDPFLGNTELRAANDPRHVVANWPEEKGAPRFWFAAGGGDPADMAGTEAFLDQLRRVQPQLRYEVIDGGAHSFTVWRLAYPKFMRWALRQLPEPA